MANCGHRSAASHWHKSMLAVSLTISTVAGFSFTPVSSSRGSYSSRRISGLRPPDPPWNMRLAMIFFTALCIGLGVWPQPLYAMLPFAVDFVPYTASHVVFYLQLLLFSGLAFFLMLGWLKRTLSHSTLIGYIASPAPCWRDAWTSRWTPRGLASLRQRPRALGDSSASFRSITRQRAFSPAPGRPAAWRFGAQLFSRHIWPCRT